MSSFIHQYLIAAVEIFYFHYNSYCFITSEGSSNHLRKLDILLNIYFLFYILYLESYCSPFLHRTSFLFHNLLGYAYPFHATFKLLKLPLNFVDQRFSTRTPAGGTTRSYMNTVIYNSPMQICEQWFLRSLECFIRVSFLQTVENYCS